MYEKLKINENISQICKCSDKKIIPFKNQDYETLKKECLTSGKLFEDPLFPCVDKSIFYSQPVPAGISWARPSQISIKPQFVQDIVDASDLDQGMLGDCWFVAGCAGIALVPELFENVVPNGQQINGPDYAGIFHFRFWYYGQWVDVVVDDRLPIKTSTNRLVFCNNRQEPDEYWAALLEKAYAKMCGAYENLDGGETTDALIDMTGGIQESFEIKDMRTEKQKNEIWNLIIKSRKHKSIIAASIAPKPRIREARLANGLVMGHAYTITKIAALEAGTREIRLVRVRNPWGNEVEWKGAYSDSSKEWNQIPSEIKEQLDYKKLPNGEFWMSYDDFYRNFESIQFCELTPDAYSDELVKNNNNTNDTTTTISKLAWKLTSYHGEWMAGKTSGGSGKQDEELFWTNPQFLLTLKDVDEDDKENKASVIVSLMQKYTREERLMHKGEACEDFIQFRMYRILDEKDAEQAKKTGQRLYANQLERCGMSGPYVNSREVTKRFRTAPGNYLIIPSCYTTSGVGEFLLRIYTEHPIGELNCCELAKEKTDLKKEDIFFENNNSMNNLFKNWANLIGSTNSNNNSQEVTFVAQTRIYTNDAFMNVHDKRDKSLYKRISKTLSRRI